jgi:hypothetical protein
VRRLGEQRDRVRKVSADPLDYGEAAQNRQCDSEPALACIMVVRVGSVRMGVAGVVVGVRGLVLAGMIVVMVGVDYAHGQRMPPMGLFAKGRGNGARSHRRRHQRRNKYAILTVCWGVTRRGGDSMVGLFKQLLPVLAVAGLGVPYASAETATQQRSVVELFTSEGCSSCPPADALAGRLTTNPALVVLSFHVNYWDDLGWKDSFSSQVSTDRQYAYARALGQRTVFTPQLILNGTRSLVGSQETDVRRALAAVSATNTAVRVEMTKQADGGFEVTLAGAAVVADVWEVRYVRHTVTRVRAGENGGRSLETFNNVTQLRRLGAFAPGVLKLPRLQQPDDGVAVLVQKLSAGEILGAAAY